MNEPSAKKWTAAVPEGGWPRIYRIVVDGQLDASWSERLAGMRIESREQEGGKATVLEGLIRDRAELCGVVNTLCDLQLALLQVAALGGEVGVEDSRQK
jgi:hypothetical protein